MNDAPAGRSDVSGTRAGGWQTPSGRANPGRLGVLSEIAALLGDEPEAPATLQAVVDGALRATAADCVQLVLADAGGRGPVAYASGHVDEDGPRHEAPLGTDAARLGLLILARAAGREPFSDADALFAGTLAEQVAGALGSARARRAEESAPARERAAAREPRSPLTALRGLVDAVGRRQPAAMQASFTGRAGHDVRRLVELAGELAALTRLEIPEPAEAVAVGEVALERLEASGLRGSVAAVERLRALVAPGRLELALDAMLANARLYAPGSPVLMTAADRAGMVVVAVDDAGPGVPEREREEIFGRFVRGSAAASTRAPGHGLGLTVVAAVARGAGGRAWCEPAPGGGARFVLSLPSA